LINKISFETRLKWHWFFRRTAYGLFVVALFLPSADLMYVGSGVSSPLSPGWICLLLGIPFWPSNAFLIFSPFYKIRTVKNELFFSIGSVVSALPVVGFACFDILSRHILKSHILSIGGWVWVLSHIALTLAFFIPIVNSGTTCPKCGYDLRASRERCPECGNPAPSIGSS
jgi:hypothetical protein